MSLENMNYDLKLALFRGLVCGLLEKHDYNCDKWDLALSLDMSFEEMMHKPVEEWESIIEGELLEYKEAEGKRFFNVPK